MSDDLAFLEELDSDLRAKKDRADALDELMQLSFLGDDEVREKVSWCLAKMGQNKVSDMRIFSILMSMYDDPLPEVKENIAWGLGELAGCGIGDDNSMSKVKELMDHSGSSVRSMAAWAAGRYHHKLKMTDDELMDKLTSLTEDKSNLVSMSAKFAIEDK